MPTSSSGLCRNWAYALRDTIRHRSASRGYGRTLSTRSASPSQIRPPLRCTARASDTSSITACRIDSGTRARSAASGPQQHAAARRGRGPRRRPVDPPERIELREEVHEGRHDEPLPGARHPQPRHLRDQIEPVRARRRRPAPADCPAHARCPRPSAAGTPGSPRPAPGRCRAARPTACPSSRARAPRARPPSAAARRTARTAHGPVPPCRPCCSRRPGRSPPAPDSPGPAATAGSPAAPPPRPARARRRRPTASASGAATPAAAAGRSARRTPVPAAATPMRPANPRRSRQRRSFAAVCPTAAGPQGRSTMVTG